VEEQWFWTVETSQIGESNANETVLERENRSLDTASVSATLETT